MAVTIDGTNGVSGPINVTTDSVKLDGNYPVGTSNVALGDTAFDGNSTGAYNVAIGDGALSATGNPNFCTGIGFYALNANTANSNTAVGRGSLQSNTTGNTNTAVGAMSLNTNTTGNQNTVIGFQAGQYATTATNNTFIGMNSGRNVTTGANHTILGRYNGNQGGLDIRTSSNNIVLSDGDGNPRVYYDNGSSRWFSSKYAPPSNNQFWPNVASASGINASGFSAEGVLSATTNQSAGLFIDRNDGGGDLARFYNQGVQRGSISITTSTSYNTTSDYRLKENVVDLTGATDRLKQLPVHQFNFIADPDTTVDGFLAHEAAEVVPEAVTGEKDAVDDEGNPIYQGIDQSKLVPLLTAALKEAITEIESLKARVEALETL